MNVIPLPELVVALAVGLIVTSARSIRKRRPISSASPGSVMQSSRSGGSQVRARLIASCVILVAISIPLILEIVPPNGVYGFRVRGTGSPQIWYPANAFMGWALLVAAVIAATLQIMLPRTTRQWLLWTAFLMPICGAVVASFAYLSKLLHAV